MERKAIKHEHNVVHYLSKRKINNKNGKVQRHVFRLRDCENGLSVNWLEFFMNLAKHEQLEQVQRCMLQNDYSLSASGFLAELNVGKTIRVIYMKHNIEITFVHDPIKNNHSHSLICGLPNRECKGNSRRVSRTLARLADENLHKVTVTKLP